MAEAIEQMKELIKEMQLGQTKTMETMMTTMFNKMTETAKTAGLDKQKGCEPGQIDERKNMKGPDPFDGQEKRYSEWKAKMNVYLKMRVPESVNILKYISKHQEKSIDDKAMNEIANDLIIETLEEMLSISLIPLVMKTD
jgi:hypothetical protein